LQEKNAVADDFLPATTRRASRRRAAARNRRAAASVTPPSPHRLRRIPTRGARGDPSATRAASSPARRRARGAPPRTPTCSFLLHWLSG